MKYYYSPGACSLAGHLVLEELAINYEGIKIDLRNGQHQQAEFLAINPAGAVPVLVLDNGEVITQNLAILIYLAEQYPEQKLIPPAGSIARAHCYEWLAFISADLHKAFSPLFSPKKFVESEAAQAELKDSSMQRLHNFLNVINHRLDGKNFALGNEISICDFYLVVMYRWAERFEFPMEKWPNYKQLAEQVLIRPAVQATLKAEGLL